MLKTFHWLLLQSERRENQLEVSGLPDLAAVGASNVWNRSPAPTFPPCSESFISRTVSGWELGIGGGIMCSPCSLEVGVCSPHAVLYFISWLQCTDSTERKQLPRLSFHTHIRTSESLFLVVMLPFISVYKDTCLACLFLLKSAALVEGAWL